MAWSWWDDFDKRFCGRWISEDFKVNEHHAKIFLKIEFETTESNAKVYYSFGSEFGINLAFGIEYKCDSLCFMHNDEEHRAEYILTVENSNLIKCKFSVKNCFWMTGLFEKNIDFMPTSEEEEKKYKYAFDKYIVEPKDLSKVEILREYAEYGDIKSDVKFEYKFDERESMLDIIGKYNLDDLVKDKSDIETAIALLHWFCGRYRHGDIGLASTSTPQALMEFADKNEGRTNCRGLALTLVQLIRAYNIKAFHVTCCPYEEPFNDCHVVVSVYCESLNKWIMFDPSSNLYLKNKDGEIIGIDEFRNILIDGGELFANDDSLAAWNWSLTDYRDYMAKNLIRLERYGVNGYGKDGQGGKVILIPEKYMQNEARGFSKETRKNFITSKEYFWQV